MNSVNSRMKLLACLVAVMMLLGVVAGCGSAKDDKTEIVMMKGNFAEWDILVHMAGILIDEHTDLKVSYKDPMAFAPSMAAVASGEADLRVTYDGSVLASYLGYDPVDVPKDADFTSWVNDKLKEERSMMVDVIFGFENTYALGIDKAFAQANNIVTTSDLLPFAKDLRFGAEHEFFSEEFAINAMNFTEFYGFEWKESKSIDIGLKYAALTNDNLDVIMVYTTDGLNKKFDLQVLEDDLKYFPQYYAVYIMRETLYEEYAETAPNLREVLMKLDGIIDTEAMTNMNLLVDSEEKTAAEVAREFLVERGLI
jgi:osmoprotectant transport system substrate-binding protein